MSKFEYNGPEQRSFYEAIERRGREPLVHDERMTPKAPSVQPAAHENEKQKTEGK